MVYHDDLWYLRGDQIGRSQCTVVRLKGSPEGKISRSICKIKGESRMAETNGYCIILTEIVWLWKDYTWDERWEAIPWGIRKERVCSYLGYYDGTWRLSLLESYYDYVRGAGPLICTESIHADQRAGCCEQAPARRGRWGDQCWSPLVRCRGRLKRILKQLECKET